MIHADETPVTVVQIGEKKSQKGSVWAYPTTQYNSVQAVVYDFQPSADQGSMPKISSAAGKR